MARARKKAKPINVQSALIARLIFDLHHVATRPLSRSLSPPPLHPTLHLLLSRERSRSIDAVDFVSRRLADSLLISSGFVVFERVARRSRGWVSLSPVICSLPLSPHSPLRLPPAQSRLAFRRNDSIKKPSVAEQRFCLSSKLRPYKIYKNSNDFRFDSPCIKVFH